MSLHVGIGTIKLFDSQFGALKLIGCLAQLGVKVIDIYLNRVNSLIGLV